MASPSKQTQQKKGGGGWGSLLSGAVAGLESRLDTILADEPEASAKSRIAEQSGKATPSSSATNLALPPTRVSKDGGSRDVSRTRANDRLAERLAKATAAKTPTPGGSGVPSRVGSPAIAVESGRVSGEEERRSIDLARSVPYIKEPAGEEQQTPQQFETTDEESTSERISLDAPAARVSVESSSRPASLDLPNGTSHLSQDVVDVEAELSRLRESESQRQEEMHAYLEKIDALQAKLSYLANETVAAAKAANAATSTDSEAKALAEKDARIALLMEEGEKLSKNELRQSQMIKKLRAQKSEDDKATAEAKKRESDLRQRVRKSEVEVRQANEKAKQITSIQQQVDELRLDRENAAELVKNLTVQLKEAKERAEKAARKNSTSEADKGRIASLENELEDAQIEKQLAIERATAEMRKVREESEGQRQRSDVRELELRNEVAGLESRVEAMRFRAEEAATAGNGSDPRIGENSNVGLLRQVETLQRQYALAKENWEAIEASLNGRVAALETERDEAGRRETEARRKAREVGTKNRRKEEELEQKVEDMQRLEEQLIAQRQSAEGFRASLDRAEKTVEEAREERERLRRVWEVEIQQRVEEERAKWIQGRTHQAASAAVRNGSPIMGGTSRIITTDTHSSRRPGSGNRLTSHDLAALHTQTQQQQRPSSRQSSAYPTQTPSSANRPNFYRSHSGDPSPGVSRQESSLSLTTTPTAAAGGVDIPPTPSISISNEDHSPASPDRTIADLMSTSNAAAAGPSVQLVERMSAAVRRLESEKAAFKDEISRLSSQRDSARDEVVALMREVEAKRVLEGKEKELEDLRARYGAALEMLGEREEEVEELRGNVGELKRLYRELVEEKMGGN